MACDVGCEDGPRSRHYVCRCNLCECEGEKFQHHNTDGDVISSLDKEMDCAVNWIDSEFLSHVKMGSSIRSP